MLKFELRSRSKQLQIIDLLTVFSGDASMEYTRILSTYTRILLLYTHIYIYAYIIAIHAYIVYIYAYITNKFE
jgi:hypothetical protein